MTHRRRRRCRVIELLESRTLLSTYYVSTTGSNGAAGTSSGAAWQTLQFAADHVSAGDTVIVAPGNYVGFDLRTSGTPSQRITFSAQPGATINAVNTRTNRDGINLENASYVTIEGFTLIGTANPATSRAGIRVVGNGFDTGEFSTGVIVRNNNADRWGVWGIFTAFADDIVIENNQCSRSAEQHGIYFSNSADRPVIRNNFVWGNAACGIHMNADIETGNTDLPNVDGIITGALVEGNTIYNNGAGSAFGAGGGSGINCDGVRNSRIVNNLVLGNHSTGIALYQIDAAAPAVGNTIANNTVINAADSRWCVLITDGATGTSVFNNILWNLHSTRGAIELSADSAAGLVSDHNLVEDRFSHSDAFQSLAQWRAATGGDAHSVALSEAQMQALFTNYTAQNFTLAVGSGAIDKGISGLTNGTFKPAPTTDKLGALRPAGLGFDIGAYERPSDVPTNAAPTIVTPAAASSPIIPGKTVGLSVLADDDGGEPFLKYRWVCTSKPAGTTPMPTFSVNGINAAKNTVVRFYRAGVYTFTAYAKDAGGKYVASSVTVTVKQKFTTVVVTPNPVTLNSGATQQFTALAMDQFNRAMAIQPPITWTRTGIGTITSTGLYRAPSGTTGFATVWATMDGAKGAASITITAPVSPLFPALA